MPRFRKEDGRVFLTPDHEDDPSLIEPLPPEFELGIPSDPDLYSEGIFDAFLDFD